MLLRIDLELRLNYGFYRVLPSFIELFWIRWFYRVYRVFPYRALPSFFYIQRDISVSTWFYLILPSFIEFYLALPSFTEFRRLFLVLLF